MIFNIIAVIIIAMAYGKRYYPTLVIVVIGFFFVFPIGLIPVGVLASVDRLSVPRNWFWHAKVMLGMSTGDFLLLLVLVMAGIHAILHRHKKNVAWSFLGLILILFAIGVFALLGSEGEIDLKNLFSATRTFIFIAAFFYLGSSRKNAESIMLGTSTVLLITFFISFCSMNLLDPYYRAIRYWVPAMLQSQQFVSAIPFFAIYFAARGDKPIHARAWISCCVLMLFMAYKAYYLFLIVLLFYALLFGRNRQQQPGWWLFCTFAFLLLQPIIVLANIFLSAFIGGIPAIDTRAFQVLNLYLTFQDKGFLAWVMGIGWGQWYQIFIPFPAVDEGAWTVDQLFDDERKFSIQLMPFSLFRSVGIAGFLLTVFLVYKYIKDLQFVIRGYPRHKSLLMLIVIFTNISIFFSIPDVLPETAAFSALMLSLMLVLPGRVDTALPEHR